MRELEELRQSVGLGEKDCGASQDWRKRWLLMKEEIEAMANFYIY